MTRSPQTQDEIDRLVIRTLRQAVRVGWAAFLMILTTTIVLPSIQSCRAPAPAKPCPCLLEKP